MSRAKPRIDYAPRTPTARTDWTPRLNIYACLCGHRHEGDPQPCSECGDQMQLIQAAGMVA